MSTDVGTEHPLADREAVAEAEIGIKELAGDVGSTRDGVVVVGAKTGEGTNEETAVAHVAIEVMHEAAAEVVRVLTEVVACENGVGVSSGGSRKRAGGTGSGASEGTAS
jgi:hypothetical protein